MNKLYEENIVIENDVLESLKEASAITIQTMAETALKGPYMATRRSVEEVIRFAEKLKTQDKNRGDVEYE